MYMYVIFKDLYIFMYTQYMQDDQDQDRLKHTHDTGVAWCLPQHTLLKRS